MDYSSAQLKKKGQRVCKRCVDMAPAGFRVLQLEQFCAMLNPALPVNRSKQCSRVTHTLMGAIIYAYINGLRLCSKGAFLQSQRAMLGFESASPSSSPASRSLEDEFALECDHQWVSLRMDDGTERFIDMTSSQYEGGVDGVVTPGEAKDTWRAAKMHTICPGPGAETEPALSTKADYDALVARLKETPHSRQTLELLKDAKMIIDKIKASQ